MRQKLVKLRKNKPHDLRMQTWRSELIGRDRRTKMQKGDVVSKNEISSKKKAGTQASDNDVGRAIDLTNLKGYNELIMELEEMFNIKGELCYQDKWEVIITDNKDNIMLVCDDSWQEVWKMVKKIFIYGSKEVKKDETREQTSRCYHC